MPGKHQYSLNEFAAKLGRNPEYVRQMCAGYVNEKGTKAHLPEGWKAKKVGRDWIIERESRSGSPLLEELSESPNNERFTEAVRWWHAVALDAHVIRKSASIIPQILGFVKWRELLESRGYRLPLRRTEDPPAKLMDGNRLLHLIGSCYRTSVLSKLKVKLEIEFQPDGYWSTKLNQPTNEPFICDDLMDDGRNHELLQVWIAQLQNKSAHKPDEEFIAGKTVSNRALRSFNKKRLCAACGEEIPRSRKSVYCSDEHRDAHAKFIDRLHKANPSKQGEAALSRLQRLVDRK